MKELAETVQAMGSLESILRDSFDETSFVEEGMLTF
jgi:hypothetical protein